MNYSGGEFGYQVSITDEEWAKLSALQKTNFSFALKASEHYLAKALDKAIDLLLEEERLQDEIDFEATYLEYYGENE